MNAATRRAPQTIMWTMTVLLASASPLGLAATPNIQMAPSSPKPQLTLVHPPGNLIVRLNGMGAITSKVFPAMIAANQPLNRSVSQKTLFNGTAELLIGPPQAYVTVGINVKSELLGLQLTVPVDPDDLNASFAGADPQKARVQSTFDFNRASLRVILKISTQPIGTVPANIPDPLNLLRFTHLSDTFSIELNGFKGNLDVRLKKSGNAIAVDAIEGFGLTLTDVDVGDSGPLEEIASVVLGLNKLFRVDGGKVNSADTAAKRLLNDLLRQDLGIEAGDQKIREPGADVVRLAAVPESGVQRRVRPRHLRVAEPREIAVRIELADQRVGTGHRRKARRSDTGVAAPRRGHDGRDAADQC